MSVQEMIFYSENNCVKKYAFKAKLFSVLKGTWKLSYMDLNTMEEALRYVHN